MVELPFHDHRQTTHPRPVTTGPLQPLPLSTWREGDSLLGEAYHYF